MIDKDQGPLDIANLDEQLRAFFSDLPDRDLRELGICLAEGITVTERLIDSPMKIAGLLCTPDHGEFYARISQDTGKAFPVYTGSRRSIGEIGGYMFHRGCLTAAYRPELPSLEQFHGAQCTNVRSSKNAQDFFWGINLASVQETSNVGTLIRTARAFRASAIVVGKGTGDPFSRKAIRSSVGHVFHAPLCTVESDRQLIEFARKHGLLLGVAHAGEGSLDLDSVMRELPALRSSWAGIILCLGHEYSGHSEQLLESADIHIRIPMGENIDSLNVGAAGAIFCYAFASGLGFIGSDGAPAR